jgi:hypothetical protein
MVDRVRLKKKHGGRVRLVPRHVREAADRAEARSMGRDPYEATRRKSNGNGLDHGEPIIGERRGRRKDHKGVTDDWGDDKPKKLMGRPPLLIPDARTLTIIAGLARIQATQHEAAAAFGVTGRTFEEFLRKHDLQRFWRYGQLEGMTSLRKKQFKMASMAMWLGKQYLGQRDKMDVSNPDGGLSQQLNINAQAIASLPPEQRMALQNALKLLMPDKFADLRLEHAREDAVDAEATGQEPSEPSGTVSPGEVVTLEKGVDYDPDE